MAFTYDVSMFKDTFEHEFTWLNGFMRNVARFPQKKAATCTLTNRSWTYTELNAEANRFATALRRDGVGKNSVIMFMLCNSPEFLFCYIAGHKLGGIACPVNYRQAAGELAAIFDDSHPDVFVYDTKFSETVLHALSLASFSPSRIIAVGQPVGESNHTIYDDYVANMPEADVVPDVRPHIYDETLRFYTSGTTTRARAVPINNINEVLSAHDVLMHFPLNSTDKTMNMTPWFHRGGLHAGGPTPTLYAGGEVVILREFNPRFCLTKMQQHEVTFLIGVPSIIALLARAQENLAVDMGKLRGIVTMGSPFEKSACEKYLKLFTPNIFNGYGTTETFWNTFLRPYNLPEMSGSAGQSCTDDEVRIVRAIENGRAEPDDLVCKDGKSVGEIIIRSPAKSTFCYVNNPEKTEQKFYKGFHYTGDLGTWDANSFVTIVSRKDDMIVYNGENIYPTQIEAVLNEHPQVLESAVIGVPDRLHGQCVTAFIVPSDAGLTVETLKNYCINHPMLPAYKRPKNYFLVDALPHTATGKIMHYKLREQYGKI